MLKLTDEWCSDCWTYHAPGEHWPEWDVWYDDDPGDPPFDDDAFQVRGRDAEHAAERAHAQMDCDKPEEQDFLIRRHGTDDEPERWRSEVEFEPVYSARRIEG